MTGTTQDDYTDRYARRVRGMTTSEIRALFATASRPEVVSLAGGSPYIAALPLDAVGEMLGDLASQHGATSLQYSIGQGTVELRERICEVMTLSGIHNASPDDVVVTVGGQQALDLLARLFLDPGDVVLAEGPTYVGALGVFQAAQAQVRHVAMDAEGLIPEALEEAIEATARAGRKAKFLYTIPTFQNPAGVTLSEDRRERVLDICERAGLLVVEDDPYGMLAFEGEAPLPLRARRREGVFYCSTFSKTFAPGLRVGWILAPHAVREKLVMMSEANVLCPSAFAQGAVTQYLSTMPWREQLKVYREIYRERRDALLGALDDLMPAGTTWTRPTGGLFVWATLPEGLDSKAMMPRAIAARVAYVPGTGFYADGTGRNNMRLNFSFSAPDRLREGIRRLSGVMEQELAMRAVFGGGALQQSHQRRRGPAAADAPGPDLA
ncbi:DNA-binding transcriptional MocR family regulator [Actinoplanes campanulatus]|uniref:DNA-binding transcriptional MocR family regulator n=1 Tax=Actinoplanes campanulatus TaxID=113559 RepID=A0A7W5AQC5_9ACTN|nr:PLP-dependent aminotransferase family protein [Actinoplanes campanulatus]MBB3100503.1 DNA-binding transcriptional MocR family regulator [Actinoplanes campanulatus]GGN25218.1 GntR family transcriptional regulator [Actinoplanes campanulatus]GID39459.1 GntR family transcriptional regulator [Actinoplanes campanulatus]